MPKSGAERQREYHERQHRSGLVRTQLWVSAKDARAIRAAARRDGLKVGEWMLRALRAACTA